MMRGRGSLQMVIYKWMKNQMFIKQVAKERCGHPVFSVRMVRVEEL